MIIEPIYKNSLITLYRGDCLDQIKQMRDNTIDLAITSPPYNCRIEYDNYDDNKPYGEYLSWCQEWIKELYRICKDDGRLAINVLMEAKIEEKRQSPVVDFVNMIKNAGFNIMGLPVWVDKHRIKHTAWGSWTSASSPYIYNPYEVIILAYKNAKKKQTVGKDTIDKRDFMAGCSGIWEIQPETSQLTKACFPVKLPKLVINLLSFENDLILDPFFGSGTTGIACMELNRKCIGIEISENYCRLAVERLKKNSFQQTHIF